MPIRMTEIPPQTPSGVAKVSIDITDIIPEISFDAELELIEGARVKAPSESPDFTPIGHILREIIPLKVRIEGTPTEPPDIEVRSPAIHSVLAEAMPDVPQQALIARSILPTKVPPTKEVEGTPPKAEANPFGPSVNAQIPEHASVRNVAEKPSIPENPVTPVIQSNAPRREIPTNPAPEVQTASNHAFVSPKNAFVPPKNSTRQSVEHAVPSTNPAIPTDAENINPSELTLQKTTEVHRDLGDFGGGIAEKLQLLRPLPAATPTVPPAANRVHSPETKILTQISSAISNTSKDTVEIRLDPPELGRVIISITQNESGLAATVTSEKAEVADLLRRHAELLSRELSKSGFGEPSLEFSHKNQREGRPDFREGKENFSAVTPENSEATSAIEMILQSQSGSLDIRL